MKSKPHTQTKTTKQTTHTKQPQQINIKLVKVKLIVYNQLKKLKITPRESFNDVISKLLKKE